LILKQQLIGATILASALGPNILDLKSLEFIENIRDKNIEDIKAIDPNSAIISATEGFLRTPDWPVKLELR